MTLFVPKFSVTTTNVAFDLGSLHSIFIGAGIVVQSTASTAIAGTGGPSTRHQIWVNGTVQGEQAGISIGNETSGIGHILRVGVGGSISGTTAVSINAPGSYLENLGEIFGETLGIRFQSSGAEVSVIANHGFIIGGETAIQRPGTDNVGTVELINKGMIMGGIYAYLSSHPSAVDRIVNRGEMIGEIRLDGGNDSFDNRGGVISSRVVGGNGNDVFLPGRTRETFDAGNGEGDTIDLRYTAGVKIALDRTFENTATAAGDIYTGVEHLIGSATGNDKLRGDAGNNMLRGLGGADSLDGADGIDVLNGGFGKDHLRGGLGNDFFLFEKISHAGDIVADFFREDGNSDKIEIRVAGFGGGLTAGAVEAGQFRTRIDDHLAIDSDDRFLFNVTDKTLWFDVDGKGGEAAILVLDIDRSINLVASDIILA